MLFHDVQERAALRNLAERDDETTEALESFLLDHYATLYPHADYLMQIVKNVLAITGSYYFSLPRGKKMQFSEPHRQCLQSSLCHEDMGVATVIPAMGKYPILGRGHGLYRFRFAKL
jgi:hypothetical protein